MTRSPETPSRIRLISRGTATGPKNFPFDLNELGFGPECSPTDEEVIAVYEQHYNALHGNQPSPRVISVDEADDFMFVDAPESDDPDPDPMDLLDDGHQDAVDVCCRILRGMELAVAPFMPAEAAEATLRWDQMDESHRDEYRQLVLDVMADDYDHETPQPLSPNLLRLRMATVLLNF